MIVAANSNKRCLMACPTHQPCSCRSRVMREYDKVPAIYIMGIDPYDDKKLDNSFGISK